MGNIFSPTQPESITTSGSKVSLSTDDRAKKDDIGSTSTKARSGSSFPPNNSRSGSNEQEQGQEQDQDQDQDQEQEQEQEQGQPSQIQPDMKASESAEDQCKQGDADLIPKKGRQGFGSPNKSNTHQDDFPGKAKAVTPRRPTTRSASSPRHSGRKRQKPTFLMNQRMDGKQYIGSTETGRNFVKDDDFRAQRDAEHKGNEIFHDHLKPAGWRYVSNTKSLKSGYVFLAKGTTYETAQEGVTKFYSFGDIWKKWKADKGFREMYPDAATDDEMDTNPSSSNLLEKLDQASHGVPIAAAAAGTPTGATEKRESTPKRKLRSKQRHSPKQKSPKRPKTRSTSKK